MSIANTILQQLGGQKFIVMTGAKHFLDCGDTLRFRIPGNLAKQRINAVEVKLTPDDLYVVKFSRVWMTREGDFHEKLIHEEDGLYCDQLQSTFTEVTGLYTRLF